MVQMLNMYAELVKSKVTPKLKTEIEREGRCTFHIAMIESIRTMKKIRLEYTLAMFAKDLRFQYTDKRYNFSMYIRRSWGIHVTGVSSWFALDIKAPRSQ